jgi:hypothetical protein
VYYLKTRRYIFEKAGIENVETKNSLRDLKIDGKIVKYCCEKHSIDTKEIIPYLKETGKKVDDIVAD